MNIRVIFLKIREKNRQGRKDTTFFPVILPSSYLNVTKNSDLL